MVVEKFAAQKDGWLPVRLNWRDGRAFLDWCYLGDARFTAPFFDQTVQAAMGRSPFNLLFRHQTPVEVLEEIQAAHPHVPPTGFIFHMSRCGSTLISQMLAALPRNIVISEAGPVDSILRAKFHQADVTDEERIKWLRLMVDALGRKRFEQEKNLFIKFDCWNTLELPLIQKAFPGVPWIFVYREPSEVIVSHLQRRGAQMIPGVLEPQLFGMSTEVAAKISTEEYCARVLAAICDAALRHDGEPAGMLVNYKELPEAVLSSITRFFRVEFTEKERERMARAAQFDAKNPAMQFERDAERKQRGVDERVRELSDKWLGRLYERLEAERNARLT